jgi:hypothetical protein
MRAEYCRRVSLLSQTDRVYAMSLSFTAGLSGLGRVFLVLVSVLDVFGDLHQADVESFGETPDRRPAWAVQPTLDPRQRRGRDARFERQLLLADLAVFAQAFEDLR